MYEKKMYVVPNRNKSPIISLYLIIPSKVIIHLIKTLF